MLQTKDIHAFSLRHTNSVLIRQNQAGSYPANRSVNLAKTRNYFLPLHTPTPFGQTQHVPVGISENTAARSLFCAPSEKENVNIYTCLKEEFDTKMPNFRHAFQIQSTIFVIEKYLRDSSHIPFFIVMLDAK